MRWIGQVLPSAISASVLKSAHLGQYQPSYRSLYVWPLSWTRCMTSWTFASWRGSVVRMKKSFDALIRGSRSRNRCALRSASSFGEIPSCSATFATGSPCSSVPVRKNTSSPRWRWCRARMSAPIVV